MLYGRTFRFYWLETHPAFFTFVSSTRRKPACPGQQNKNAMENKHHEKLEIFQLVILVLSIYVLATLFVSAFFNVPPEVHRLLTLIDNGICFVFLFDFFYRLYKAPNKWKFLKWGWIDFISSIPHLEFFWAGRTVRLLRILRIVRAFRSSRVLFNHIFKQKSHGTFASVSIIAVLTVIFSSIAILEVETAPDSNIKTAEDALWWSYTTITTVGYGDRYPVTTEGRIVAMILMTVGVGLFGTFAGFIATWFVEERKEEEEEFIEEQREEEAERSIKGKAPEDYSHGEL